MFTVIKGDGTSARPCNRHQKIVETARHIEQHARAGRLGIGQTLAKALTPIERAFVTERMFRNGLREEIVVRVLAP